MLVWVSGIVRVLESALRKTLIRPDWSKIFARAGAVTPQGDVKTAHAVHPLTNYLAQYVTSTRVCSLLCRD